MQIDTHIPPPAARTKGPGRSPLYPFAAMPIGGSFAASPDEADKISCAARAWKRRHPGWNYRTQKTPNEFRLWRIE